MSGIEKYTNNKNDYKTLQSIISLSKGGNGNEYLHGIHFNNLDETRNQELKSEILKLMDIDFAKAQENIELNLKKTTTPGPCKKNQDNWEWQMCLKECEKTVTEYVIKEISSTAYILRVLSASVIIGKPTDTLNKIVFDFPQGAKLTGIWKNDKDLFTIKTYGTLDPGAIAGKKGRLIMGFGPSASGKTYWAKNIISIFSDNDPMFPGSFFSIDGGIYRESSEIYKIAKNTANKYCYKGFENLAANIALVLHPMMFKAGDIKSMVQDFLKTNHAIQINLYVPETLGSCLVTNCRGKYDKYIKITGDDQWIALLICQHKYASECDMDVKYKCFGCTESGMIREKSEGKKYSNDTWLASMRRGKAEGKTATGGFFMIHNSGGQKNKITGEKCKSIILNLKPELTTEQVKASMLMNKDKYNYLYTANMNVFEDLFKID